MMHSYEITPIIEKIRISEAIKKGKRLDGRKLNEMRELKIETGYVKKAEGSAFVSLGDTKIVVGIKVDVGAPYPDTPNSGVFLVNAEFVPTASPTFEPGPPDENAIELARVVDRGIRHAELLDLEKLCIIPGEKVYIVFADIYVIDHCGNLFDASTLGVVSAAITAKIPKFKIEEDGSVTFLKDEMVPLPIKNKLVTLTWGRIGDDLILDPSIDEEQIMDARLTIGIDETGHIVSMQKGGMGSLTIDDVTHIVSQSMELSKEIMKYLPNGG